MFSPERNEPSKPTYLALVKSDAIASSLIDSIRSAKDKDLKDSTAVAMIEGAKIYPTPSVQALPLSSYLRKVTGMTWKEQMIGKSSVCHIGNITPNWQATGEMRCTPTGYQEIQQIDGNPASYSYNLLRWINIGYNPSACPIMTFKLTGQMIVLIWKKGSINFVYTDEADMLNMALFGMTAKQWRIAHPDTKGNIRFCFGTNHIPPDLLFKHSLVSVITKSCNRHLQDQE